MAPSTAYTRASMTLTSASNSSFRRSLAASRIHRYRDVPARSLWWWGRHGTWSTTTDESLEERIQRHQKIMRHRYSRALRRRAMWDRDDSPPSWLYGAPHGRLGRRWGTCRSMTSTDPAMDGLRERQDNPSKGGDYWNTPQNTAETYDRDFEAFKAAIDRAIQKDPYGTLFGRPVRSPPTENNSSWISWLFARNEDSQPLSNSSENGSGGRKIEIEVLDKKKATMSPEPSDMTKTLKTTNSSARDVTSQTGYVYDPISGRKIPMVSSIGEFDQQPKQSFLEVLFSENGNNSPDRVHKHQKVYDRALSTASESGEGGNTVVTKAAFENSRKHEYQQLRAATLGNNIDTTAEFGSKFEHQSSAEAQSAREKTRSMPEPNDNVPLFSGTTYESKLSDVDFVSHERPVSWLVKEGFQTRKSSTVRSQQKTNSNSNRLEPAFDRMQSASETHAEKKFVSKLQPAVDRVQRVKPSEPSRAASKPFDVTASASVEIPSRIAPLPDSPSAINTREDVDLLRASDVRAATRSARTTKQDILQAKNTERSKLEDEFNQLQQRQFEEPVLDATQLRADSDKSSRDVKDAQTYVNQYSDSIVATTLRSLGILSHMRRQHDIPSDISKAEPAEETEILKGSQSHSPSIIKPSTSESDMSSVEALRSAREEEATKADLRESLRQFKKNAEEVRKRDDEQIAELANGIRYIYEAELGPIDLSLAQSSLLKKNTAVVATQSQSKGETSITKHQLPATSLDFFAERARFLQEVNHLSKSVAMIKSKTTQLEADLGNTSISSNKAMTQVDELTTEARKIADQTSLLEAEADRLISEDAAKPERPHPLSVATVKLGVPQYPAVEHHTKVFEPRYIQILYAVKSIRIQLQEVSASIHDLKRSRTFSAKEDSPAIQTSTPPQDVKPRLDNIPRKQNPTPTSPYLILIYNKNTGEVDQTALERLPWARNKSAEKANPIRIMGKLNYPAAFVSHFVQLEKAGYELSSGGGDMLLFQKKAVSTPATSGKSIKEVLPLKPATRNLRNTIAAAEASAQPEITETIAQPKNTTSKQAATVLDDIPVEIPTPGPAAPTAPPPGSHVRRTPRSGPKVRRQEQVFSGTLPLRTGTAPSQKSSQDHGNKSSSSESTEETKDPSFFSRAGRTLKQGVLGVAAFGATAYMIGAVAEGIGAQAQADSDAALGPRTKVVMPVGQRAGIYSTESSRD